MSWLSEELEPPVHTCHAHGCDSPVRPEFLMCRPHWAMVPVHIRRGVWRNYRPGQCVDKKPSVGWTNWANAAIGWVAMEEGRRMTKAQETILSLLEIL